MARGVHIPPATSPVVCGERHSVRIVIWRGLLEYARLRAIDLE